MPSSDGTSGKNQVYDTDMNDGEHSIRPRTYLRFVPADDKWNVAVPETDVGVFSGRDVTKAGAKDSIVRELGTCLRLIECEKNTPLDCHGDMGRVVYDFWDVAKRDILADWMRQTNPKNLQPRVRPLNHSVADFIRDNTPTGIDQDDMTRALNIVETPWTHREEAMLRKWFNSDEHKGARVVEIPC